MQKEFIAFISLGFGCGGPEMGDYGTFSVELNDEEISQIDEAINADTTGYKRRYVEEYFPELHQKILDAAFPLAKAVCIVDGIQYSEIIGHVEDEDDDDALEAADEEVNKLYEMPAMEAAKIVLEKDPSLDVDDEDVWETTKVCYYLTRKEIPGDYKE